MNLDKPLNPPYVVPSEVPAPLKANGIKPELGYPILMLHVDMRRLAAIPRIEEEPIRPDT